MWIPSCSHIVEFIYKRAVTDITAYHKNIIRIKDFGCNNQILKSTNAIRKNTRHGVV